MIPFRDTSDEMLGKATFSDFLALDTSRDTIGIHPYTHQNQLLDEFVPHGPRTIMNGFNYQLLSIPLLQYTVDALNKYIKKLGEDYVTSIILFEGYPHGKVCEIPCDATAFAIRTSSFRTAMAIRWKGEQHDEWAGQCVESAGLLCARSLVEVPRVLVEKRWQNGTADHDVSKTVCVKSTHALTVAPRSKTVVRGV